MPIQAQHILVETRREADDILRQLYEGADFGELARTYSMCPTKDNYGFLGEVRQNEMVKPFEDAAFGLPAGAISNPVKTQFGYHIIKRTA